MNAHLRLMKILLHGYYDPYFTHGELKFEDNMSLAHYNTVLSSRGGRKTPNF